MSPSQLPRRVGINRNRSSDMIRKLINETSLSGRNFFPFHKTMVSNAPAFKNKGTGPSLPCNSWCMGKMAAQSIDRDKLSIVITGITLRPVCLQALKYPITDKTLRMEISSSAHDINISDLVPIAPSSLITWCR